VAKSSKRPKRGPQVPSRKLAGMNEFIYKEVKKGASKDLLWTAKKSMSGRQKRLIKELNRRDSYTGYRSMTSNISKKYTEQIPSRGITTFGSGSKPIPHNVGYTSQEARRRGLVKRTGPEAASKTTPVEQQKKSKIKIKKDPLGGYKAGTYSPIKIKNIKLSPAAKKALLKGAKLATKGATRVIPGVGTAMLIQDAYKVTKWAMDQPKSNKKRKNIYGTNISKSGYNY